MGNSDTIFHKSSVLAKKYDGAGPGYVPIQITPQEHNSLTRFFKFPEGVKGTTVGDALKVLNFPRRLLDKPYLQLTAFDVNDCSKLGFLIKTLSRIKNKECVSQL